MFFPLLYSIDFFHFIENKLFKLINFYIFLNTMSLFYFMLLFYINFSCRFLMSLLCHFFISHFLCNFLCQFFGSLLNHTLNFHFHRMILNVSIFVLCLNIYYKMFLKNHNATLTNKHKSPLAKL